MFPTDEAARAHVDIHVPQLAVAADHHPSFGHIELKVPSLEPGERSRLHLAAKQSFIFKALPALQSALFTNNEEHVACGVSRERGVGSAIMK